MSDEPNQDVYLRAIYSYTRDGRVVDFSFTRSSIPGSSRISLATAEPWAIISARNPMSRALDESANEQRDQEFISVLHRQTIPSGPAEGRSPDGAWREASRFLPGLTRDRALALARRFEQRAMVWSERGKTGLIECRTEAWVVRPIYARAAPSP